MSAKKMKLPKAGMAVVVWPAQRTVRDANKKPVMRDGQAVMRPARVRDESGAIIAGRISVRVNSYYFKLINRRSLDWCTPEEHLDAGRKKPEVKPVPKANPSGKNQTA